MSQAALAATRRRDFRVMGVVGVCHFFSHFYQFVLPPLFLLINASEGYSLERLALLISVFYAASFALQIPCGFLVDRIGARNILMAGVVALAGCTMLYGVFTSYPSLVVLSVLAGAANSVFHPADYSILNASVNSARIGRAFSVHNLGGFAGYALAPVLVAWLGQVWGWQNAALLVGAAGLVTVVAAYALSGDFEDSSHTRRAAESKRPLKEDVRMLFGGPMLLCLLFFILLAAGQLGPQWFTDKIYSIGHGIPVVLGNSFISIFVVGITIGIVTGGIAADRSRHHLSLAAIGFVGCGVTFLAMAVVPPEPALIYPLFTVSGFLFGFGFASRDIVVRRLAPPGASGTVYGFVFSGLDIGAMIAPAVFGFMLDGGLHFEIFYVAGALIVAAAVSVQLAGRSGGRDAAPAPP